MLEKEENDRINEFKRREERAQNNMARMADKVLENQTKRLKDEEERLRKFEQDQELRHRMNDERRYKKQKDDQANMRNYLA